MNTDSPAAPQKVSCQASLFSVLQRIPRSGRFNPQAAYHKITPIINGAVGKTKERLAEIEAENERLRMELARTKERSAELETQIAWFKHQVFGGGKGEKVDPAQLELGYEETCVGILAPEEQEKDSYRI